MIQPERIKQLNDQPVQPGRYVLYWMQASQRACCNHALEYAIRRANELQHPLLVIFGLTGDFPAANIAHYRFMLEGLVETQEALRKRGVTLVVRLGPLPQTVLSLAQQAALLVADRGYLRVQRQWREQVARAATCQMVQVESDVVVPVEVASPKEEVAARTLRPKLTQHLNDYLLPLHESQLQHSSLKLEIEGLDLSDLEAVLKRLHVPHDGPGRARFTGGTGHALQLLKTFLSGHLADYDAIHSDPAVDGTSHLSPYLHFGQISPLQVALTVSETEAEAQVAFLEQLIIRRELACNMVFYNNSYDQYACVPAWARQTLGEHAADPREASYTVEQLERAETADPYWNAAMREMTTSGYMHNYLRMYWGKRVLAWMRTPDEAYQTLVTLNNKYFLDGRDPVSWTSIAWCFGKHDRPWPPRPVFGTVRSMNARGLERKFDMQAYLARVAAL